jgi:N-hydroxyarylamine O-acetyltransferase
MFEFPLDEYRERVGLPSGGGPSLTRLQDLHSAQIHTLPYENFDVLLGREIDLGIERLVDKMVRSDRGGYCFELNGLFKAVLEAEGFEVRTLLARVHLLQEPTGRGHQIALVSLGGREWIVDVGNGAYCPRQPLPFEHEIETTHNGLRMRIVEHPLGHMVQAKEQSIWKDLYSFDLSPVVPADIDYGNHFTSTHPQSFFRSVRIAVLFDSEGETVIFNNTCTIRSGEQTSSEQLADNPTYLDKLRELVGIDVDAEYEALPPLRDDEIARSLR